MKFDPSDQKYHKRIEFQLCRKLNENNDILDPTGLTGVTN